MQLIYKIRKVEWNDKDNNNPSTFFVRVEAWPVHEDNHQIRNMIVLYFCLEDIEKMKCLDRRNRAILEYFKKTNSLNFSEWKNQAFELFKPVLEHLWHRKVKVLV